MHFIKIKSYAKINLSLNINGKLKSKYHKIESLVSFINLYDVIYLREIKSNKHKVYFKGKFANGITANNTVLNLLKILDKNEYINNKKFEIKVIKNIPQKSGLGGGSMNAANLISFFFKKKILKINKQDLINITRLIGSDVILGLENKNTVLSSNGNIKRYDKKLGYYVLIVKPNFGCSTKLIYSAVRDYSRPKYNYPKKILFNKDNIVKSKNELEKVAFKKYSKLKNLKSYLSKLQNIIFVRMSGSGSSFVVYFHSKKALDIAEKEFKRKYNNYWCIKSKTI